MGKKLRNRLIQDTSDLDTDSSLPPSPTSSLTPSRLRNVVAARIAKFRHLEERRVRFSRRVRSGQIANVVREGELDCPICLELMVSPTALLCGHLFCYRCLQANTAHSQRCSLCRFEQGDHPTRPSVLAETLIQTFVLPNWRGDMLAYLCRVTESAEWAKKRKVGALRVGSVVDLRDQAVWRRAVVVRYFINDHQKNMVEVRIGGRDQTATQVLELTSSRLAPFTFFTRNRYLLDFPPQLPEHDLAEREMRSLEYRPSVEEEEFFRETVECEVQQEQSWFQPQRRQSLFEEAFQLFGSRMEQEVDFRF